MSVTIYHDNKRASVACKDPYDTHRTDGPHQMHRIFVPFKLFLWDCAQHASDFDNANE